jgi:hypothetical protein
VAGKYFCSLPEKHVCWKGGAPEMGTLHSAITHHKAKRVEGIIRSIQQPTTTELACILLVEDDILGRGPRRSQGKRIPDYLLKFKTWDKTIATYLICGTTTSWLPVAKGCIYVFPDQS